MPEQITRRSSIALVGTAALPLTTRAQQPSRPIIGILDSSTATATKLSGFYDGLRVEGFIRNQNVAIEYRSAESNYDRLPDLAADLVKREVSLIVAFGVPAALAAKSATTTTPIIFAIAPNPVRIGLVVNLNRPGRNMTGVTNMAEGHERTRLEMLHELIPTAPVLALLINPQNPDTEAQMRDALETARVHGVQLQFIRAAAMKEFDGAFAALAGSHVSGLAISDDELFLSASAQLASLAAGHHVPAIFQGAPFARAGGVMSYGNSFAETYHQTGVCSGLILHGATPAQLPVYQSTKIEFIVNLGTAKSLGLTFPPNVLDRATEVIK
jgi:putative ABC transport system substrate-binding protein